MAADIMIMKEVLFYNHCACRLPSINEIFEQQLCSAKVWHVGQSWTEATEHSKLM